MATKINTRQLLARSHFEDAGYPRSGAAALVGNFCREVGPTLPTAYRPEAKLDHGSQGLAQWRGERRTSYENYVKGLHPELTDEAKLRPYYGRLDNQIAFCIRELKTDYPALDAKLRKGGDPAALAADVCWQYERPNRALSGIAERVAYAQAIAAATDPAAIQAAPVGVIEHLRAASNAQHDQANGGMILGSLATAGIAATVGSNFMDTLPTWEWVAIGLCLLLMVVGFLGYVTMSRSARKVEAAIPGVTPDAPPAAAVAHTPVLPPEPLPAPPAAADTSSLAFKQAVAEAVAQQLASIDRATAPVVQANGATMSVIRPTSAG